MQRDNLSFYERAARTDSISIVSVPTELGSDSRGLAKAPQYLLKSGLEKAIRSTGADVAGIETVAVPKPKSEVVGSAKYLPEVAALARKTADAVEVAARKGPVIALGGDHSMAIGSIAGASRAHSSLGVIWIDAHPDCNTPETSISGNLHGQVTSALMGYGDENLTSIGRRITPEDFLYIGLKDLDEAEISFLREHKAKTVTVLDIASRGLFKALNAIDTLARRVDTIWISMDMDSVDQSDAPGVGLPNTGGLTKREVLSLAQYIGKSCRVAGFDIVEIAPERDIENKTVRLAIELAARFLGGEYSWYQSEYMDTYAQTNAQVPRLEQN